MLLEVFKFEVQYRLRRVDTYVFFFFLLFFSLLGVEFIFQGVPLGMVKKNAAIVIAKTMGAICGLSMLVISIVMGESIIRDFRHQTAVLIYVNPMAKSAYFFGKFLGSLAVLLFIFSALLLGMILGECMPWIEPEEYAPFRLWNYLQSFFWVALPIILFAASVFFVTGALTRSLLVVYTQGLVLFVLFLLTKAIDHDFLQAILDPFSLSTLSTLTKNWTVEEHNALLIPWTGLMFWKNSFWALFGLTALFFGYRSFQLKLIYGAKNVKRQHVIKLKTVGGKFKMKLSEVKPILDYRSQVLQLFYSTQFEVQRILKQSLFWAIVISGVVILCINSINLGTRFHVDSYPTSYLIVEELQEMSIYFFVFILLIYSGELIWKEKDARLQLICDASPAKNLIRVGSKFFALTIVYVILLFLLMVAAMVFQSAMAYFQYELHVYFVSFFLELLILLVLYTMASFFFQTITGHKFVGMIFTIVFCIGNVLLAVLVTDHVLLNFGGNGLTIYSEMNGYGRFLSPYLWGKVYWLVFGTMLLILACILMQRGVETKLQKRWFAGLKQNGKSLKKIAGIFFLIWLGIGSFLFYNTNVLNEYWTPNEKNLFRANYEKELKQFEYLAQAKIVDVQLNMELYPSENAYEIKGRYQLVNPHPEPIREIHLQKQIAMQVDLAEVRFDRATKLNDAYRHFHYFIYQLEEPLRQGDSMIMHFLQKLEPSGFANNDSDFDVLYNGSFFTNKLLPSFAYQRKYELEDSELRKTYGLGDRQTKAAIYDPRELLYSQSGSDSDGISLELLIGTEKPQIALSSGNLLRHWSTKDRNYFHYKTDQEIIDFYPIISAAYETKKDCHQLSGASNKMVDLEIYYHKDHAYNLDRMMESMKYSLDYFSTQFGTYPFSQLRIAEIPRYHEFAQSFPSTVAFSEGIGFMMDINDDEDVDMVFFVTAHELAHQWWGVQLEAANVQGKHFILETLAQYSALMVFKEKYPADKLEQFLRQQHEDYLEGVRKQDRAEPALAFVEDEEHIYYAKGVLNMYALQKAIGEEKLNLALRDFIQDWKTFENADRPNRYAISQDLIKYLKKHTPKDLHDLVLNLFEELREIDLEALLD